MINATMPALSAIHVRFYVPLNDPFKLAGLTDGEVQTKDIS